MQYVKRDPGSEIEWTPVQLFCGPCKLEYEIIGHVEHQKLSNEEIFLAEAIAPPNHTISQTNNMVDTNSHREETLSAEELAALYFEQLDDEDVRDLYKVYENDFILFGYSFTFRGMTHPQQDITDRC